MEWYTIIKDNSLNFKSLISLFFVIIHSKVGARVLLNFFIYSIMVDVYNRLYDNIAFKNWEILDISQKRFGKVVFIRNTPVIVSGRRFKKGLFEGLSSYFKPFIEYSLFHKKSVYLDDPR